MRVREFVRATTGPVLLLAAFSAHAQQYELTDLGTLGGFGTIGTGINASGQVTGYAYTKGDAAYHAFLYGNGSSRIWAPSAVRTVPGTASTPAAR
jgi:probable HAF family extracellular repeat protein